MPIFRYNETAGNYYAYLIEGHGDDANDGLTPETAVASMDRLAQVLDAYTGALRRYAVIVKHKIYNEAFTTARTAGRGITFEFINKTIIDNSGPNKLRFLVATDEIINAHAINHNVSTGFMGVNNMTIYARNCFFENINPFNYGLGIVSHFDNCVFINCLIGSVVSATNYDKCVVINCTNNAGYPVHAKNTVFYNSNGFGFNSSSEIDYCLQYGLLNGKTFEENQALGFNLNGLPNNPQFTDPANGQYTVNQSSPCLYRGEGGEHIGIGEGFYLQANILYFQQSAINNFQLTTGRLGFIDPLDNAFIETNPIDIGQIITLESAELAAILPVVAGEFTAGPVHYSHWYPAYSAASTYHKGAGVTDSAILYRSLVDDNLNNTPASSATEWERLTWESGVSYAAGKIVQYTDDKWYKANTATSTSWVAGEWDEVVMTREWNLQVKTGRTYDEAVAADWATIPYNVTPLLDTAGKGNSDDAYNPATGAVMVFRFIAVRIDAKTIV